MFVEEKRQRSVKRAKTKDGAVDMTHVFDVVGMHTWRNGELRQIRFDIFGARFLATKGHIKGHTS